MEEFKNNFGDLLVYTLIAFVLLIPFLAGENGKHICGSLLIGFLFGLFNRIIRELDKLNKK